MQYVEGGRREWDQNLIGDVGGLRGITGRSATIAENSIAGIAGTRTYGWTQLLQRLRSSPLADHFFGIVCCPLVNVKLSH